MLHGRVHLRVSCVILCIFAGLVQASCAKTSVEEFKQSLNDARVSAKAMDRASGRACVRDVIGGRVNPETWKVLAGPDFDPQATLNFANRLKSAGNPERARKLSVHVLKVRGQGWFGINTTSKAACFFFLEDGKLRLVGHRNADSSGKVPGDIWFLSKA